MTVEQSSRLSNSQGNWLLSFLARKRKHQYKQAKSQKGVCFFFLPFFVFFPFPICFFLVFFWEINCTPFNSIWLPTLPTFLPVSFPSCRSDWLPAAESGVQGRKWKWKLCSFAKDNHRPLEIYETWKFLGNSKLRPKISFKNHPVLLCIT